jgi:hypothetical protein
MASQYIRKRAGIRDVSAVEESDTSKGLELESGNSWLSMAGQLRRKYDGI